MVNTDQRVKLTRGIQDGSTATDYNTTGSGYISLGCTPSGSGGGGGINKSKFTPQGIFPVEANGSTSTYYTDGLWFNTSMTSFAEVGGASNYGMSVGAFYSAINSEVAKTHWEIGAALSCKPLN